MYVRAIVLLVCLAVFADGRGDGPRGGLRGIVCPTFCLKCIGCPDPDDPRTWCTDTNQDGYTSFPEDMIEILINWGEVQYEGCPARICLCINCDADVNGDGWIDSFDLLQVLERLRDCRAGLHGHE